MMANRKVSVRGSLWISASWILLAAMGCGGGEAERREEARALSEDGRSRSLASADQATNDQGRCDASQADRETSEYDTSGDEVPDVRKVFRRIGEAPLMRLILICREADLNGDGIKDVVRHYTDEGRPLREEADRDFDGQMDEVVFFEEGRVIRLEADQNRDGQVDTKVFYERGTPVRSERDIAGRSTVAAWRPDRWEYFEHGRLIRMGTDLDGDGRVDRWDRDEEGQRAVEDSAADAQRAEDESLEDEGLSPGDGSDGATEGEDVGG